MIMSQNEVFIVTFSPLFLDFAIKCLSHVFLNTFYNKEIKMSNSVLQKCKQFVCLYFLRISKELTNRFLFKSAEQHMVEPC